MAATRDRHTVSISVYIVLAAVITVVCVVVLPDRSRANIDDAAVYSRA
jgi:sensor domain CHASE-containing protein